ncbi:MAG: gamma carbonic anhydrase family protein [Neisseria sp.]|nr:gamma carbonic anhydrase family protein [Neisseria sp.]
MSNIRPYLEHTPQVGENVYLDPASVVIGDVVIGDESSVWPCTVIRGDVNRIRIGRRSNIQDLSMLHVSYRSEGKPEGSPLTIGDEVTIGHHVTLHGCTIHDRVLVGMGSIVLDDAVIEENVIIGAGSVVSPGKRLASGFLYLGAPAKAVRPLTEEELAWLPQSAAHYVRVAGDYLK